MDLGNITVRGRGRASKPLPPIVGMRELTVEEVLNSNQVERATQPPPLVRVSFRHHRLARMLAEGATPGDAAAAVGLSSSRVSILQNDPSFQNLIQNYKTKIAMIYADAHTLLAELNIDSAMELQRRLEDEPDSFSNDQLMRLTQIMADRTGFGPTRKDEKTVNINIGARLEAARQRAAEITADRVIEGELVDE